MSYAIFNIRWPHEGPVQITLVPSMDAAKAHLATLGEIVAFELDVDGIDAADAAVTVQGHLELYSVEAA